MTRMSSLLTFCYIIFQCNVYLILCIGNKETPFKMGKVNSVWNKAQKLLKGERLADLYADLIIQDKQEKELKKRKFDGLDKDGLFEADVRQELVGILRRYHLDEYFTGEQYTAAAADQRVEDAHYEIRDTRLKKMLKNARKEGFTETEMQLLKEELGHHQLKLDEYNSLKENYHTLEERIDNSLDNLDEQETVWSELAQGKIDMKDKHKQFTEGLKRTENKLSDWENSAGKFEDPRVYKLWALAQKAGLDETELDSIRTELTHFETRIHKAEYIQGQVDKAERKQTMGEDIDLNKHSELQDRAKLFHKKVEKYEKDLTQRIHRRLDEL